MIRALISGTAYAKKVTEKEKAANPSLLAASHARNDGIGQANDEAKSQWNPYPECSRFDYLSEHIRKFHAGRIFAQVY
ncbi:MAG: hypothetical protein C4292_04120 [Nitrososphaera sp.]